MSTHFTLLSCGSNAQGQLGNGSLEDASTFQLCQFAEPPTSGTRVIALSTGANHTLLLLETSKGKRELWGCGDGRKGQLGRNYQHSAVFCRLDLPLDEAGLGDYRIKSIAATWETSYAVLCSEGKQDVVISMGSNDYGDLGVGSTAQKQHFHVIDFQHITDKLDVLGIYSGQRHIILHISGPMLVGWGASRHGQLGALANTPFASVPQTVSVATDGIASLHLGLHHTVVLYSSGEIKCLGSNRKRQLEVVTSHLRAQSIGCAWNGTYAVVNEGNGWRVFSSGSNSHNQLGWPSDDSTTTGEVIFQEDVDRQASVAISCGSEHVLLLKNRTQLLGWGWNEHGNLGVGHTNDVPMPVTIYSSDTPIVGIWAGLGTSWCCSEGLQ